MSTSLLVLTAWILLALSTQPLQAQGGVWKSSRPVKKTAKVDYNYSTAPLPLKWEIIPDHPAFPFIDTPVVAIQVTDSRLKNRLPNDPANEDCTATFQEAIDAVEAAGGGTVFVPAGEYAFLGTLTVPRNITLRGHWQMPRAQGWNPGTVLKIAPENPLADGKPFLTLESGTGLMHLNFYYPNQDPENIQPYPPTLHPLSQASIDEITLVNSYVGIYAPKGAVFAVWQGIFGSPLKMGIHADHGVALPRFHVVALSPKYWQWWPGSGARADEAKPGNYAHFMKNQGTGFALGNMDGFSLLYSEIEGYHTGLQTGIVYDNGEQSGPANGTARNLKIANCQIPVKKVRDWVSYQNCTIQGTANGEDPTPYVSADYRKDWERTRKPAKPQLFDVTDPRFAGGAKGDRVTDDTKAVHATMDAATKNGGGIVFFPPGAYRLTSPIQAGDGIELRGNVGARCAEMAVETGRGANTKLKWTMSIIVADYKGPKDGQPLITMGSGSGVRGMAFFNEAQNLRYLKDGRNQPIPEPYVLRMIGKGNYMINFLAPNSYQFVDFKGCEDFLVEHFLVGGVHRIFRVSSGSKNGRIQFGHNKPGDFLGALADDITTAPNRIAYRTRMPGLGLIAFDIRDSENIVLNNVFNRCVRAAILINNSSGIADKIKGEASQSGYIYETGGNRVFTIVNGHLNTRGHGDGTGRVGVDLLETFHGKAEFWGKSGNYDHHFRVKSGELFVRAYQGHKENGNIEVTGDGKLHIQNTELAVFSLDVGPNAKLSFSNVVFIDGVPLGDVRGKVTFHNVTYESEYLYSALSRSECAEYGIHLVQEGAEHFADTDSHAARLTNGNSFHFDVTHPLLTSGKVSADDIRIHLHFNPLDTGTVKVFYNTPSGEKQAGQTRRVKATLSGSSLECTLPGASFNIDGIKHGKSDIRVEFASSDMKQFGPLFKGVRVSIPKTGSRPRIASQ